MTELTSPHGRVKDTIRECYDDSDEPKATKSDVIAALESQLHDTYQSLMRRGEIYEYGHYVRVTDDVL